MGNMFQFKRDYTEYYTKSRDVSLSKELNPALQSFQQWLDRNKERIPVE
jgi:hypothetical protein